MMSILRLHTNYHTYKKVSAVKRPRSHGRVPLNIFAWRFLRRHSLTNIQHNAYKKLSSLKRPKSLGIVPVNMLVCRCLQTIAVTITHCTCVQVCECSQQCRFTRYAARQHVIVKIPASEVTKSRTIRSCDTQPRTVESRRPLRCIQAVSLVLHQEGTSISFCDALYIDLYRSNLKAHFHHIRSNATHQGQSM
jgi:hypothetical protein